MKSEIKNIALIPSYLGLKALSSYSSCSVRWLRDRLIDDRNPLPHFRIEGKILVKVDEFDQWMMNFHATSQQTDLEHIIDDVLQQVTS